MQDFVYYNPTKVLFGQDANAKIAPLIAQEGIQRVLMLYGGGSIHRTGVYSQLVCSLEENGVVFVECPGVKQNPLLSKVEEAISLVRERGLQAILAVGGGSVIDSAKAISLGVLYDGSVWDFYSRAAKPSKALPLYVVSTVSATASEMNSTSVLTNETLGHKSAVTNDLLFPRATSIDPSVQSSVPVRQTVNGGVDAICHVLETYFDGTKDVELQMEYSEGLVRSIMRLVEALLKNPCDYQARAQFAWASVCALNGTTWAGHLSRGDFASHAMGHSLSAAYDAIHGETLSVLMPAWMKFVMAENLGAFSRFSERVFQESGGSREDRAAAGIEKLRGFFASLGAPTRMRDLGVPEDALPRLAADATRGGPVGTLKKLQAPDVLAIMQAAY